LERFWCYCGGHETVFYLSGVGVGLADSLAAFHQCVRGGGKLEDLMSQVNHPNRKGHDLVVAELIKWFPKPATSSK
jgi:hypothetical protein